MRSENKLTTSELTVSWSNIQAWIEAGLRSVKGIPDNVDIVKIKLDYPGGYVGEDKVIPVEIISREEVQIISFG